MGDSSEEEFSTDNESVDSRSLRFNRPVLTNSTPEANEQENSDEDLDSSSVESSSDENEEENFPGEFAEDVVSPRNELFDIEDEEENSPEEDQEENPPEGEEEEDLVSSTSESSYEWDEEEDSSTEDEEPLVSSSLELTPLKDEIRDMYSRGTTGIRQNISSAFIKSQDETASVPHHINNPLAPEEISQLARRMANASTWTPLGNNRYRLHYADSPPNEFVNEPTPPHFNELAAERHAFLSELMHVTLVERRRLNAVREMCIFLILMQDDYNNVETTLLRIRLLVVTDIVRNLIGLYVFVFFLVLLIFL